jgi:hypothetical protein
VIASVRDVLEGRESQRTITNVSCELYEELDARAKVDKDLVGWEGTRYVSLGLLRWLSQGDNYVCRVDFYRDVLIVGYPTSPGHEVIADMFERLDRSESYPLVLPNGSKIVACGTADVPLTKGVKSPYYSLYEVTDHVQPVETELNSTPTVVFEYGYTETSHKLALDAARHLLLSQGLVQLVVVVDVKRKPGSQDGSMTLEGVTWAHWEVDGSSFEEVESSWRGDLDDPQPDRDVDEDFVQPPADAYKAVIEMDGMKYHLRASKVNEWEVPRHFLIFSIS